ncbi:transglutaminase family protein [Oculatella sp. LEGE 06141]|uniref:transglutaminase-like domain-containing protein n=1 Tax=Oculatella sp. LEGE 06141 TaxID=1828648 RepID=UPI0018809661|nr:transglutaminase family protein [Oculatella sp. LEGE 06141]MBE9180413.1 transglutaminase family protein [Oculatella sp. LEGE 06141]
MQFKLGCELSYTLTAPSTFIFNIGVAQNTRQQVLDETLSITPTIEMEEYVVPETATRFLRVNPAAGDLHIRYNALVELSHVWADPLDIPETPTTTLPLQVVPYLFPSRYCQSDRLMNLAQAEFGDLLPGYSRVTAICNWIYDNVAYLSGSTNQHTSAYDTAVERAGVCRDFAHLAIAFCRALGTPARFVSGYAYQLNPPDFHAFFEAYLGDRWYLFDATRLVPMAGLVRIGTGKDAADVSFATIFGTIEMTKMQVFIDRLQPPETSEAPSDQAVSTA